MLSGFCREMDRLKRKKRKKREEKEKGKVRAWRGMVQECTNRTLRKTPLSFLFFFLSIFFLFFLSLHNQHTISINPTKCKASFNLSPKSQMSKMPSLLILNPFVQIGLF